MVPENCLLVGDLGGTHARFALAETEGRAYTDDLTLACSDFETAESALSCYLDQAAAGPPAIICLAAAGPVVDGVIDFMNSHWTLDSRSLARRFPSSRIHLMNDFEANAWCIPLLEMNEIESIGPVAAGISGRRDYTVGVLGPGTGLGVAALVSYRGQVVPVSGEGSHIGFAPENTAQQKVLNQLGRWFERVSNERLLSGQGLQNIYRALLAIRGESDSRPGAAQIFRKALDGSDVIAVETVELFYQVLGQVAGDLALTLGAFDGIYIAGGIVKRYPDLLRSGLFRAGFENKGRYRAIMKRIPTLLITHEQPGLLGASHVARRLQGDG